MVSISYFREEEKKQYRSHNSRTTTPFGYNYYMINLRYWSVRVRLLMKKKLFLFFDEFCFPNL